MNSVVVDHMNDTSEHKVPVSGSAPDLSGWIKLLPAAVCQSGGIKTVKVFWGKLCLLILLLVVASYLFFVSGLYFYAKYARGILQTSYTDLLLPTHWEHYRAVQGEHYISFAEQQIREGKILEAFHNLRVGVAKSPENVQGRLLLARFWASANRFD